MIKGRGGGKKKLRAQIRSARRSSNGGERKRERASFGGTASRAPLPSLSFTVTITLALAPVPFPGHDCLIDRDYATKRPVGIAVVRKITFRPDGNKYSKEAEQ